MKQQHLAFQVILAVSLLSLSIASEGTSLAGQDDSTAKLSALLTQRRDTLRELVKVAQAQYRVGRSTLHSVIRASDQLLKVELELAEGHAARLGIHKQRVELLKDFEKVTKSQFEKGQATQEDVLTAQAAELGAEIDLLREQSVKR